MLGTPLDSSGLLFVSLFSGLTSKVSEFGSSISAGMISSTKTRFVVSLADRPVPEVGNEVDVKVVCLNFLVSVYFVHCLFGLLCGFFVHVISSKIGFPFFLDSLVSFYVLVASGGS